MYSDKQSILIDMDDNVTPGDGLNYGNYAGASPEDLNSQRQIIIPIHPAPESEQQQPKKPVWSMEYFQQFFDVDTDTVVERIIGAVLPKAEMNFSQRYIRNKPDLYGPFWICATLVFSVAIGGNLSNYFQTASSPKFHWKYNFHEVSASATMIFFYCWGVPIALWTALKSQGSDVLNLLELLCIYGYSMSIYVPISILWVIQVNWLQWILVLIGGTISGYVLVSSIRPAFHNRNYAVLLVALVLHVMLAIVFMLYFFHIPSSTTAPITSASNL